MSLIRKAMSRIRAAGRSVALEVMHRARLVVRRGGREEAIGPPIFIVGCGHSGTTLLLSILSAHSRLYSVPYESGLAWTGDAELDWFVRSFNSEAKRAGKARWVEKTPRHIHHIAALLDRFPAGKVILMIRDGRDVACSIRDRTGSFDRGVDRWLRDNAAGEPFFDDPAVYVLRYEDLIADRAAQLAQLLDFVGEDFEPALIDHHESGFRFLGIFKDARKFAREVDAITDKPTDVSGSGHRRYRSWQASQPVFDGRNRWQTDMNAAERDRFKELAGDRLIAYGYAVDDEW